MQNVVWSQGGLAWVLSPTIGRNEEAPLADEYHEALLERVHEIQREVAELSQREALSYAYLVSRELPEEGARMLVAELLLDYWARTREGAPPGIR